MGVRSDKVEAMLLVQSVCRIQALWPKVSKKTACIHLDKQAQFDQAFKNIQLIMQAVDPLWMGEDRFFGPFSTGI